MLFAVIPGAASFGYTQVDPRSHGPSPVGDRVGVIAGRISPDVSVRIIAKLAGTRHETKENVKGEVTLPRGGEFMIENLPPAKYDLLFFVQGASSAKYMASRWSEVVVEAGKVTSGINCRLTPQGSEYLIDEVNVGIFNEVSPAETFELFQSMGCTVKNRPLKLTQRTWYLVDIPDDKSVDEMIVLLQSQKIVSAASPNHISTLDV